MHFGDIWSSAGAAPMPDKRTHRYNNQKKTLRKQSRRNTQLSLPGYIYLGSCTTIKRDANDWFLTLAIVYKPYKFEVKKRMQSLG